MQNVIGDYVFYSYQSQPSDSRSAIALLNVSKTFHLIRGVIGLRGIYNRMENNMLSQEKTPTTTMTLSP
ncbi:MAG: hypothetical protein ACOYJG_02765 [Prevotella sp.]